MAQWSTPHAGGSICPGLKNEPGDLKARLRVVGVAVAVAVAVEMTKDRYFVKDDDPSWSECSTIEEWMRKVIDSGSKEEEKKVIQLLQAFSEEKKEKYRAIWKELKKK